MKKNTLLALSLMLICILNAQAAPKAFLIDDELGRDSITISSDAPVEIINGSTTNIKGKVIIDDSLDLKELKSEISFTVDLTSIDTGIPLRNEHMRDNFLETNKFPNATFIVTSIQPKKGSTLKDGEKKELSVTGEFTVHGVTVKKEITVYVTYLKKSGITHSRFPKGDVIRIQSTFPVFLAEHNIERPKAVFYKLADTINVTINAFANEKGSK